MRRAGIWVRVIRVSSHICDFTRYFHPGRLTAQTQFFLNLSDRHPLGPEGRRNGSPLSGGKRTFCGIMSVLTRIADELSGQRQRPLMTLGRLLSSRHAAPANDDEGSPEQGVSMTRMGNIRSGSASNWRPIGRTRHIIDGVTTPWQREHR